MTKPLLFDLINNSRYIWKSIEGKGKFKDYPLQASWIFSNLKRSDLTTSQFSDKTGIPNTTLKLLNNLKDPSGNDWSELKLEIIKKDSLFNSDQYKIALKDWTELLSKVEIISGIRKYPLDLIKSLKLWETSFHTDSVNFKTILNHIGFDLSQWEKLTQDLKHEDLFQKDRKRVQKHKEKKMIPSFKTHSVILGTKEQVKGLGKLDKQTSLRILGDFRKLNAECSSYTLRQFCEDIDALKHFRSLVNYNTNFDKYKSEESQGQSKKQCPKCQSYVLVRSSSCYYCSHDFQYKISVEDNKGEKTEFVVSPLGLANPNKERITDELDKIVGENDQLKKKLTEKEDLLKMYEEENSKLKHQKESIGKNYQTLKIKYNDLVNKMEVIKDYSENCFKEFLPMK